MAEWLRGDLRRAKSIRESATRFAFAMACAAVSAIHFANFAAAQKEGTANDAPGGVASPQKALGDLGSAIMSAVVNDDGTLLRGEGVIASGEIPGFTGNYEVRFGRDVTACAFAVTGTRGSDYVLYAQYRSGKPDGIFVASTSKSSTSFVRSSFSLIVYCGR